MLLGFLKKILPEYFKKYIKLVLNYIQLVLNYINDFNLYRKYSTTFSVKGFENKESILILNYHGIEKGLLHEKIKPKFAKNRIKIINDLFDDNDILSRINESQVFIGCKIAMEYYDLHKKMEIDISDYFTEEQYLKYLKLTKTIVNHDFFSGVNKLDFKEFYADQTDFYHFSHSRKSIRSFTGEKIKFDTLKKVIELSNNAPSVCNRQASKVYLVEDKQKINECLKIQGGFTGFSQNVTQLLILTTDRSYFYLTGERNQLYIDGGIYLLNLLYALHFYKIAACPANWGKDFAEDNKVRKLIDIPKSEQVICMIPIGIAQEKISFTLSYRRTVDEVLKTV